MPEEPVVLLERRGVVALITINRPAARNAVDAAVSAGLGAAFAELDEDPGLRVGVLTGAGRAFCAGADLKELAAGRGVHDPEHPERGFAGITRFFIGKPVIAAVNGFALGGGTEIVLACDLAVAAEDAVLGLPEVTRGLVAAAGGLLRMPRQVPQKVAAELALTGAPLPARDALRWGLVNRVVAPQEVLPVALALAEAIGGNAPLAVQASKRLLAAAAGLGSDWDPASWSATEAEFDAVRGSADAREGATAFAEKRPPRWTGR